MLSSLARLPRYGDTVSGKPPEKEIGCSGSTMLPGNHFRIMWDLLQMVFLTVVAVMEPIRVGFEISAEPWCGDI
eukprot:SAG11_NODE_8233_length_1044_cov_0.779894_2_plen_74_part_00